MSESEQILLHTGLPPQETAATLAEVLHARVIQLETGALAVRRATTADRVRSVGGEVVENYFSEEDPEPGDESVLDNYDTVFDVWVSGRTDEELLHAESSRLFDEIVAAFSPIWDAPTFLPARPTTPRIATSGSPTPTRDVGAVPREGTDARGGRRGPSGPFLDLVDRVRHQAVGLAVHGVGRLRVRCLDEAEDAALALVHPVAQVVDVVSALDGEVRLMSLGDVVHRDAGAEVVHVHEERHLRVLP
jgi:hypothetical protein